MAIRLPTGRWKHDSNGTGTELGWFTPGLRARNRLHTWRAVGRWVLPKRPLVAALVAALCWVGYQQLASSAIFIDAILVPKPYEDLGWAAETMSRRVRQELFALNQLAQTQSSLRTTTLGDLRLRLPVDMPTMTKVEVPGVGMSISTIVESARELLNRPSRRVQGEVVIVGGSSTVPRSERAAMTLRIIAGQEYKALAPIVATTPELLARCAAERILEEISPLVFAITLYRQREFDAARRLAGALAAGQHPLSQTDASFQSSALNLLGNILLSQGDYKGAMAQYEAAIGKDKANRDPYVNEAMAYHRRSKAMDDREDAARAIEMYRGALSIQPADPVVNAAIYVNIGIAHQERGEHEKAAEMFSLALDLDLKNVNALINWGVGFGLQGDYPRAIEKFEKALSIDDQQPAAYVNWGYALGMSNRFKDAYAQFNRAALLAPNDADVYAQWAEILKLEGDTVGAADMEAAAKSAAAVAESLRPRSACGS